MDLPGSSAFHQSFLNTSMISDDSPTVQKRVSYGGESFPYGISGVAMPDYGYSGSVYNYSRKSFPRKSRVCCYCGKSFTRSTTRRYHEKRCPLLRAAGSLVEQNEQPVDNGATASTDHKFYAIGSQSPASLTNSISPASDSCRAGVEDELSKQPVTNRRRSFDQANLESVFVKQEPSEFLNMYVRTSTPRTGSSENNPYVNSDSNKQESSKPLVNFPSQSSSSNKDVNGESVITSTPRYDQAGNVESHSNLESDSLRTIRIEKTETDVPKNDGSETSIYKNHSSTHLDQMLQGDATSLSARPHKSSRLQQSTQGASHSSAFRIERRVSKMINKHRCGLCGKLFDTQKQLQMHEQLHTKFRPYTCRFCGQRFTKSAMRIRHERSHLGEKPFMCIACGSSFTRNYSLKLHEQRRHSRGPCICTDCGKVCESLSSLKFHTQKHESFDAFAAKDNNNSTQMEPTATGITSFSSTTPKAAEQQDNPESLKKESDPPSDSGSVSQTSNKKLPDDSSKTTVAPSTGEEDDAKAKVKCNDCGKEFTRPYLLKYHIKVHAGLKPFECPICGKRFGYKNNMKSHLKLHAGIKPYQCCVCDAKFTRGSTLRRHARKHGIMATSIWDLFSNSGISQSQAFSASNLAKKVAAAAASSLHTSKTNYASQIGVIPDSSDPNRQNYDSHSAESSIPQSIANGSIYLNYKHSATQHTYHSPLATSAVIQPTSSVTSYSPNSPPLTALNLSIKNKPDVQYQSSDVLRTSWNLQRPTSSSTSISSNLESKMSTPLLLQINNSELLPTKHSAYKVSQPKAEYRDFEAQTNLCDCSRTIEDNVQANMYGAHLPASRLIKQESSLRYSPVTVSNGTSPVKFDKIGSSFNGETVSSLLTTGRMFVCEYCECYFKEYAMYRIHQKLHVKDESRPYLCPVCNEDCHDRIYFSLHISEHLK
ncbi:zinc finger protein 236-like [Octopus vulgaris]|uniref:Zinc finger protein 236-like n=2 Tax=Octopus TaxID=6643 RepID=A0AA36F356_OCTVU|nr:zinc finger protein 236-like [Octopus sinensis]XP_036357675.1 zinc finger protein 236-like [Octopus sinensis]XP_036357676.1 zinc finger protein 236-like [Octopus sinensis]XP_036357677.1 zinc finger protein 236-like [Octopus sinensis]XP_036357678.1 zinc finger protein 236-like [Octopus sinensis]CAI9722105.1 zinc finger protein 236-like [Octopus vulgaris]